MYSDKASFWLQMNIKKQYINLDCTKGYGNIVWITSSYKRNMLISTK